MSRSTIERAQYNRGMRLAIAVILGLVIESMRGASLPMLAPVIALQLLAGVPKPPGKKLVFVLLGVIIGASLLAYAVATMTLGIPGAYGLGVAVLYLWGFSLCFVPRLAMIGTMAVTMIIVVTAMSAASTGAALGLVGELTISVIIGLLIVAAAHAWFPHPDEVTFPQSTAASDSTVPLSPVARAMLATLVMLPLHLYLTSDGVAAMVILLTTATMLRQPGIAQSRRYAVAYAMGNGLGGILAAFSAIIYALHSELLVLISLVAATSFFMASRIIAAQRWAPVLLPGFVAYVVLFGLTLSSLPLGSDVAVLTRVLQIAGAAVYALAAVSLFVPLVNRYQRAGGRASA